MPEAKDYRIEIKKEIQRQSILKMFDNYIEPHIIGDLKHLDNIQPETHGNSCAVPTAMLMLSALEFIGYFLSSSGNLKQSGRYIRKAMEFNNFFPKETYTSESIDILINYYRHGLMHSFYPIRTESKIYAIQKSSDTELFQTESLANCERISLNVNTLSKDFKIFIRELYNYVRVSDDSSLLSIVYRRLNLTNAVSSTGKQTTDPPAIKTP